MIRWKDSWKFDLSKWTQRCCQTIDWNTKDKNGKTLRILTCQNGHKDVVKALIGILKTKMERLLDAPGSFRQLC